MPPGYESTNSVAEASAIGEKAPLAVGGAGLPHEGRVQRRTVLVRGGLGTHVSGIRVVA